MDLQEKIVHVMQLDSEHEGTKVFICPECGRMLLIEFTPFAKTVIEEGDQEAKHVSALELPSESE